MRRKTQKNRLRTKLMEVVRLKKYGLTNEKISRVTDVPIEKVNQYFREQERYREVSGVF